MRVHPDGGQPRPQPQVVDHGDRTAAALHGLLVEVDPVLGQLQPERGNVRPVQRGFTRVVQVLHEGAVRAGDDQLRRAAGVRGGAETEVGHGRDAPSPRFRGDLRRQLVPDLRHFRLVHHELNVEEDESTALATPRPVDRVPVPGEPEGEAAVGVVTISRLFRNEVEDIEVLVVAVDGDALNGLDLVNLKHREILPRTTAQ